MKNLKKILLWTFAVIVVVVAGALAYLKFALPNVGDAPELKVEMTPERIARGEYLANHVAVCIDCHSQRDWSRFSGPPKEGTYGMGGDLFDQKFGFPGAYYAKNITPAGISHYTDGELFRVITTGVDKYGKALFPIMPSHYYGQMDQEDIKSIIAYIRTLKPIENKVPESTSDFPMNFIINTLPHKASFTKLPPKTDVVNYGKYLATAASCIDCHTKFEKGALIEGTEFGGGRQFPFPDGSVVTSSNISPDVETGIGGWNEDVFVTLFRAHSDSVTMNTKVNPGEFNSIMPWTMYGKMHEDDLRAIFAYLKTVKPIKNSVVKFSPSKTEN
ncbi:MAG TPA: cytochrome c [Prolixibacteraceae bacterium]|nr:cytochrome c [Prolixibacteraceae bacterium]